MGKWKKIYYHCGNREWCQRDITATVPSRKRASQMASQGTSIKLLKGNI